MGNSNNETHVKRSSSMSFAMRWKHENLRLIILIATLSIAAFMCLVLLNGTSTKSVSVVVNGQESVVKTKQSVLQRLLDEQSIKLGTFDHVSMPLSAPIKSGDKVVIQTAIPYKLVADGKTRTLYTTSKTVSSILAEQHITLSAKDRIWPPLDRPVKQYMTVKIVRVSKKTSQQKVAVPYTTVKTADASLLKGKTAVVKEGKDGVLFKQFVHTYEDGKLVATVLASKKVTLNAVPKVIAVGTKKPAPVVTVAAKSSSTSITRKGLTFKPKKVIKNVTLTAYAAGVSSTGKSKSHPQYGITASGTRVTEGRTIAVDPRVIPIGYWVYIEGIGYRRAEDKGGAVKGNKIDVYFDSESTANNFGRKSGYTVYVIGPKKPASY
ncbi:ubiquitin-like domain-containing protein [Paenibacillus gansuensis]|uniref:Ubiquitin-like domain-containing protein n=1 Tax=Paenibacillus gansuensis TaxID=306542 RepID=A0ABW5PBM4_9BACL